MLCQSNIACKLNLMNQIRVEICVYSALGDLVGEQILAFQTASTGDYNKNGDNNTDTKSKDARLCEHKNFSHIVRISCICEAWLKAESVHA